MAKRHGLCLIFFFICTVFPAAQEEEDLQTDNDAQLQSADVRSDLLDVNAERASILGEEPSEILSLTVKDTDVSLFMHGYWKGTFGAQWGFQKNRFGIIPERLQPIIEQEPNLDISLWIYKKWFVEAFFEEGNSEGLQVSSYAAGFKGDQDDFVQFAVIGNKGLDFPKYPYINLGGDTPLYDASSSVGFYGKFGANKLKLHMLVRYDIASREERIFVGNSERSYSYLGPSARIRGISFVLPQKNIQNNITVYIEDKKGDYSGDGSLWRIAKPGEYATSATFGLVELATTPSGKVAVHYGTLPTYKNAMGFYGDGSSFLNEAQRYFYENDLTLYPQAGQSIIATGDPKNTPGVITINGNDCLVIYEAGTFSPFERQTLYKSPTSNSVSASLVNSSTNDRINGFTITERADNSLWYDNGGGFNKNFGLDTNAYIVTQRSIFELMLETETYDARSVRSRWSIARDLNNAQWNSLVYLTDNFNTDVSLRWTNLSSANGYYIGTDVVEGSVQVKRSGLDDPDFNFNNSSGYVTLANSAGINEIIRITYLKRSNQSNNGSLAAGLGTVWNVNDHFTTSSALAFRWNVFDQEQFSQYGNASPGTLALTNKFNWNYEKVQANFNIGGGWERTDTIGLYRAAGMEGSEQIIYLNEQNSFISTPPRNNPPDISNLYIGNRADLRYRNYKKTETLGNSYLMDITENAAVQEDVLGPYQANDPSLGGVILAAEFALDPSPLPLQNWSGFQVQIANGTILSEAREIELPFRFYDFNNYNNFSVVVQIGTLPVKDSAANENTELLIQKTIFSSAADTWHESPRLVRLILNDDERRKLQNANYIRYVFINNGSANISGRFLAAPLIVRGAKFAPIIKENGTAKNAQNNVTTTEMPDNAAASLNSRYSKIITRLHKDDPKQRVLQLKWDTLAQGISAGAGGRIGVVPFFSYKKVSFFINGNLQKGTSVDFVVAQTMDSFGFLSKTALQVNIKSEYLNAATGGAWTKIELRYAGVDTGVFIGEQKIPANITYQPNSLRTYNYDNAENENGSAFIMIFVNPPQGGSLTKNSIMIDEIILEDSTDELWLNSGGRFRYQNDDVILSVKKKAAIEKVSFETAVETAARGTLETEEDTAYFGALQRSSAGVVIFGTKLSGQFAYSAGTESSYWWNGGHGISRNIGPVFLGETFFTDPEKAVWQHSTEIRLNGNIYAHVSGSSNANDGKELRNFSAGFGVSKIGKVPLGISLDANAAYTEKLKDLEENETDIYNNGIKDNEANTTNYAKTWLRSAEGIIIDNGSNAQQRNISHAFNIGLNTIPVGVQLTLDGINTSSVLDSKIDSGTGSVLKFPFKAKSISGSFTQERIFKRRVLFLSDTFINDLYAWADAIQTSTALLCNAPFYSLFDPDLTDKLHNTLKDSYGTSEYGRFQDRYRFLIRLAERYGLSTLYIPKSFEAQIYRETSQTYDTILDMINVGAAVHFSAINLFGAFGAKNIFKFYQNDQYNTSIFYDISIPKESDLNWRFGVNQDIAFYGFKGGELALSDVINILKTGYTMAFNISLLTPAKRSLLGTIFDLIINRFENKSHFPLFAKIAGSGNERLREEEVELFFNNTSDSFNWSINASHKTIVRILGTLNLNVFAGLGLNTVNPKENPEQKTIFFTGTIGTSISIQF